MDYSNYEVEDFLMDPGFINYCLGRNETDKLFWEHWLVIHPEQYENVARAKELYFLLNGNHSATAFMREKAQFLAKVDRHLAEARELPAVPRRSGWRRHGYLAGAVTLCSAVVFFSLRYFRAAENPSKQAHVTEAAEVSNAGERKSFQLPDGTKVMLNASSKLTLIGDFNVTTREVALEGEAFFDVVHEENRPFIIHTRPMDIHVLGTSFNVKAYAEDDYAETALLKGAVKVLVNGVNAREVVLHPNQKVVVANIPAPGNSAATKTGQTAIPAFKVLRLRMDPASKSISEVCWTENCLAFNDNSLEEIAVQLERWYRIRIRFDNDSVKQFRYTATFDKKTIGQVLGALAISRPFDYRRQGDSVIVINSITMKDQR